MQDLKEQLIEEFGEGNIIDAFGELIGHNEPVLAQLIILSSDVVTNPSFIKPSIAIMSVVFLLLTTRVCISMCVIIWLQFYLFYFFANQDFIDLSYSGSSGTRMPRADSLIKNLSSTFAMVLLETKSVI
jgi:hypothetical protein